MVVDSRQQAYYTAAMRTLFADPKTDLVFHRVFGSEQHKPVLVAFLNDLLELDEAHRVVEVELLSPKQRPRLQPLMYSVVDAKCVDARGTRYAVKMQVLNVEGFEKWVVYDVTRTYTRQLHAGQGYPEPNDMVGITICEFELWPRQEAPQVPLLSRWRMQEQKDEAKGPGQLQFVFLELPKYDRSHPPRTPVERWAYFFLEAVKLKAMPEVLSVSPYREALEAARAQSFTEEEWEAYLRDGMAIQDKRGALSLARKEGKAGSLQSMRKLIRKILQNRGMQLSAQEEAHLEGCEDLGTLERWLDQALTASSVAEALG